MYIRLKKQSIGGHIKNLVHTRIQEKGAVTPQETDTDLPRSVRISGKGVGWWWPAVGSGAECGSVCKGPFEGGRHYLHYFHHSLVSGQTTGREHSPAHQQKLNSRFAEHGSANQNKTQFPLQ